MVSPERIRMELVSSALPAMAASMAQSFGDVHLTQIGSGVGDDPTALFAGAIKQAVEIARAMGVGVTDQGEEES